MRSKLGKILVLLVLLIAAGIAIYEIAFSDDEAYEQRQQERQEEMRKEEEKKKEKEKEEEEKSGETDSDLPGREGEHDNDDPDQPTPTEPENCPHSWKAATCTEAAVCRLCGEIYGEPLGHNWSEATCKSPKTCQRCFITEGEPLAHSWKAATCKAPKTCSLCGATEGSKLEHTWKEATCTQPKTCSVCGTTEGDALGHDWLEATTEAPKTCARCGETEGEPLYSGGAVELEPIYGSFNSSTGTSLNLHVEWTLVRRTDGTGELALLIYLSSYQLDISGRANGISVSAGGQTRTMSSPAILLDDGLKHDSLIGYCTFDVADSSSVKINVAFNAMVTYSGTYLGTITASGTAS